MSIGSLRVSLLVVALAACDRAPPMPSGADPLASLALHTIDGTTFDPTTLTGKTVIVNFWKPS
jgi:hypothetical protein